MAHGPLQTAPIPWNIAGVSATRGRGDVCLRIGLSSNPFLHRNTRYISCEAVYGSWERLFVTPPASPERHAYVCKTSTQSLRAHPPQPVCTCPRFSSHPGPQPISLACRIAASIFRLQAFTGLGWFQPSRCRCYRQRRGWSGPPKGRTRRYDTSTGRSSSPAAMDRSGIAAGEARC